MRIRMEADWGTSRLKQPNLEFELFAPVAIVTGLSIAALIILMIVTAGRIDGAAARREQALVVNGVREQIVQIEKSVAPQAVWDEAVRRLDNRFDEAWTEANIGQWLGQSQR